jgi:hypothetical protein
VTAAEYAAAYAANRRGWPKMTAATMKKIRDAYAKVGAEVSAILANGAMDGKALDAVTLQKLDRALLAGAAEVEKAIREFVPELVAMGADQYAAIETQLLTDLLEGIQGAKVTPEGIAAMFAKVAEGVVKASLGQVGADGLNFYARAVKASEAMRGDVLQFIRAGIAQGRDLGELALDATRYFRDGKKQTVHRWGENIEPDSKQLLRRVPERVDYRALRIARSELARGLQDEAKENGRNNPAALDLYDWLRINTLDHGCVCPSNAANSPYTYDNIPGYAHPHCQCVVRVRLRNLSDFKTELRNWIDGGKNDRLENWLVSNYRAA